MEHRGQTPCSKQRREAMNAMAGTSGTVPVFQGKPGEAKARSGTREKRKRGGNDDDDAGKNGDAGFGDRGL